ncbi:hypothetical protein FRC09_006438 [Ceratobasidium sp. 395]|nr:hypothetical protein FRC09_006438 [Ceratobasidium sp. 395]
MVNVQSAPVAPVSASAAAPAPAPTRARGGEDGLPVINIKFTVGDRPKGTPGKGSFQLKEVLGLSSPVYSSILLNVRDICGAGRLNMRKTISKQSKPLLRKVYDTIIDVYTGLLEFDDPYWVAKALVYVVLKSCVDRYNNSVRAMAKPKSPKLSPKSLKIRQKARREAQRKSALARVEARKAAKAAAAADPAAPTAPARPATPAAPNSGDDSIEDMIRGMNSTVINDDSDDDEMDVDGPILIPELLRGADKPGNVKNTKNVQARELTLTGATRSPTPEAGSPPANSPAPNVNRLRDLARSRARPPLCVTPEPAANPAPTSTHTAKAPASAPTSAPSRAPEQADDDIAALVAAGKGACSRFSATLFPLGSLDPSFGNDDESELSDASTLSDDDPKNKAGRGGAGAKAGNGGATSKKAATTSKKAATTSKKAATTGKKAASTSKSATTTTTAKGSGAKAKSTKEPTAATTQRKTRSSANA